MNEGSGSAHQTRTAVFISHANPEDNTFTIWLGAKLAALGYEVWADILRIRGGHDWQRRLEQALRDRAAKVLLVGTQTGVQKQGVRNEIQIAHTVAKAIGDPNFIIPLRVEDFDAPFLIAHAQYIDFKRGWSSGLKELLETLDTVYCVPKSSPTDHDTWKVIQQIHARPVVMSGESLVSNWVLIRRLPDEIRLFTFQNPEGGLASRALRSFPWPLADFGQGFLSFTPLSQVQAHGLSEGVPIELTDTLNTRRFLREGWDARSIERDQARNFVSDLARQAIEQLFRSKGLQAHPFADRRDVWWGPATVYPEHHVSFDWPSVPKGRRQIRGHSERRGVDWHFGVSVSIRFSPLPHVRFSSHLVFTTDGATAVETHRMHRLRRSFARGWRNARWRDMLLAFLAWLSGNRRALVLQTSEHDGLILQLPPLAFRSPVSVSAPEGAQELDDDDPADDDQPHAANAEDEEEDASFEYVDEADDPETNT